MPIRSLFLLPVELILPILGVLLIRTKSPIRGLIYRSFLGSIAALLYAVCGAPDVALTEVLVGTLLSSILYIITIRACYSIVIIVPNEVNIPKELINNLKSMFNELKMNVVFEPSNLSHSKEDYQILFSSKMLISILGDKFISTGFEIEFFFNNFPSFFTQRLVTSE